MVQRAMPLRADNVSGMPPVFLVTAEMDPLRDEGIAFAKKLEAAGIEVDSHHFGTAAHGFASSEGPTAEFNDYMARLCAWIEQRG